MPAKRKLKPCPFCASRKAGIEKESVPDVVAGNLSMYMNGGKLEYRAGCSKCFSATRWYATERGAANRWNNRPEIKE